MADGRFAPSPTGPLHLGNLRTALLAWLFARSAGSRFVVRMEDLDRDRVRPGADLQQLSDLAALGLDWDGPVIHQTARRPAYEAALAQLARLGRVYPCYCSRREISEAASAPHEAAAGVRPYPGTCRRLTARQRAAREASGRRPALRLRADADVQIAFVDRIHGLQRGRLDDAVVCRNDGVPAYALAVVVDDAWQRIGEVVRGDDLLPATVTQIGLNRLLSLPEPAYAHVPLVLGPDGQRLAKRHGAVTLADCARRGRSPAAVLGWLAASLGLAQAGEAIAPADLLARFDPQRLPRAPWRLATDELATIGR